MKQVSTLFLKAVIILIGVTTFILIIPTLRFILSPQNVDYYPHLIAFYLSAIPFFFALYQAFKLLNLIDVNKSFSELSIKALKKIKYSEIIFAGLYIVVFPYAYYRGDMDDAPGPIAFGIILIFGAIVAATFTAVLQKLIQNGLDLKSENDLTV